jgi:hypothetical protein
LQLPRRRAYQPKGLKLPLDETSVAGQLDQTHWRQELMMVSDKKIKADPAPKSEPAPKDKSTSDVSATKAESSETSAAGAPSNYSRGEGQKPVSQAYKDNWNAIYGKKTKMKKKQ